MAKRADPPNLYVADARSKNRDEMDRPNEFDSSYHSAVDYPLSKDTQNKSLLHCTDSGTSDQFLPHNAYESDSGMKTSQQSTPKVSFINDEKIRITQNKQKIQNAQRRQSRRYSIAAQTTMGGKICAVWRNVYTHLGLRQWAFVAVLVAYAFLGGLIFSWLEKGHIRRSNLKLVNDLRLESEQLADNLTKIINQPWLYGNDISRQRNAMVETIKNYQYRRGLGPKAKPVWDIWDGVFFSFTVFTTIGYGHYTPVTKSGRLATILYALIGIPLLLAILADFGRLLTRILKRVWSFLRNGIRRVLAIRRLKKLRQAAAKAGMGTEEDEDIDGIAAVNEEFNFPIPLAIFFIVAWMFICSALFHIWEKNWSYFDAFYFFFISLSTVGLGDLVPEHQKYMIANFPFVLIGLSLVTLVINLIQNKIEEMKEKANVMLDDQMGLEDESEIEPSGDHADFEQQTGEEQGHVAVPVPTPRSPKHVKKSPKPEIMTLGIIQTHKLPKNRRTISTQTDESYVRDAVYRKYWKASADRSMDRLSQMTNNSEYFDAQSAIF